MAEYGLPDLILASQSDAESEPVLVSERHTHDASPAGGRRPAKRPRIEPGIEDPPGGVDDEPPGPSGTASGFFAFASPRKRSGHPDATAPSADSPTSKQAHSTGNGASLVAGLLSSPGLSDYDFSDFLRPDGRGPAVGRPGTGPGGRGVSPSKGRRGRPTAEQLRAAIECSICQLPWTQQGNHAVVSLKCGHCYGRMCIERWLVQHKPGKCPACRAKASKRDVRRLFAQFVFAEDASKATRAMELLATEKRIAASLKSEVAALKSSLARLESKVNVLKQVRENKFSGPGHTGETPRVPGPTGGRDQAASLDSDSDSDGEADAPQTPEWKLTGDFELLGGRLARFSPHPDFLYATELRGEWACVSRIWTVDGTFRDFLPLYAQLGEVSITDLAVSPDGRMVASTGSNGEVKLFEPDVSGQCVGYELPQPSRAEALAWSHTHRHHLYVGDNHGTVAVFDIRKTNGALGSSSAGFTTPIVSLLVEPQSGLVLAKSFKASGALTHHPSSGLQLIPSDFGIWNRPGVCTGLAVDASDSVLVASIRAAAGRSAVVSKLPRRADVPGAPWRIGTPDTLAVVEAGPSMLRAPAAALWNPEQGSGWLAMPNNSGPGLDVHALPDEPGPSVHLPHPSPVYDALFSTGTSGPTLLAASDNKMTLHGWSDGANAPR